jgi:hypothetical protein
VTDPSGKRATVLKSVLVLIAAVSAACSAGCTTVTGKGLPAAVARADRIGLFVPEHAIADWDGKPGFDGIIAQIMLYRNEDGGLKSVLVSGEVDVMFFEGPAPDNLNDAAKPFFTRTFTSEELARRVTKQYSTLWGYALRMGWESPPQTENIWLIARYRPPAGPAIYSSPAEQTMPADPPKPRN